MPQSVYKLDTTNLKKLGLKGLRPGESWTLPEGLGTVTFTGVKEYGTFDVAHDPGKEFALIAAILAIAGLSLSLFIPRRRVWVRVTKPSASSGAATVEVAGLSRTDEAGLRPAVDELVESVKSVAPVEEQVSNESDPDASPAGN